MLAGLAVVMRQEIDMGCVKGLIAICFALAAAYFLIVSVSYLGVDAGAMWFYALLAMILGIIGAATAASVD